MNKKYTLYLDASGDPSLSRTSKTPWYTLAGIALTSDQFEKCDIRSKEILSEYVPTILKEAYPISKWELHYTPIACGGSMFRKLDKNTRFDMIKDVYKMIVDLKPYIAATSINKKKLIEKYQRPHNPLDIACRSVWNKFSEYCKKKDVVGTMIFDDEDSRFNIQKLLEYWQANNVIIRNTKYNSIFGNNLSNIDGITFAKSYLNVGIQLADFIAGAVWQKKVRKNNRDYEHIKSLWGNYGDTEFP